MSASLGTMLKGNSLPTFLRVGIQGEAVFSQAMCLQFIFSFKINFVSSQPTVCLAISMYVTYFYSGKVTLAQWTFIEYLLGSR